MFFTTSSNIRSERQQLQYKQFVYIMAIKGAPSGFSYHHPLLLLLLIKLWWSSSAFNIEYRPATTNDVNVARKILFHQAMNPLSIRAEHMIVATDETNDNALVGFGQIRPIPSSDKYCELASVYVDPSYRRKGIASSIIQQLLDRHDSLNQNTICLLTLKPTTPLYEKYGFQIVTDISTMPQGIQLEFRAGSMISTFLGNNLVCMVRENNKYTF